MTRNKKPFDLQGKTFGRWKVLEGFYKGIYRYYTCECDCGNVKEVRESSIVSGDSRSCGCLAKENCSKRNSKHYVNGEPITRHRLYKRWWNMNRRCYQPKSKDFHHYGGRGIEVCDRWRSSLPDYKGFENFVEDMADFFIEGLELDRIDNEGNYTPDNCKWSTRQEQVINSRRLLGEDTLIQYQGKSFLASQWEIETGIKGKVISDRVNKLGWDVEKALNTPLQVKSKRLRHKKGLINFTSLFKNYTNICASLVRRDITVDQLVYFLFKKDIYHEIAGELIKVEIDISGLSHDNFDFTIKLTEVGENIIHE